MEKYHIKNLIISLYKVLVYVLLYAVFILVFGRINYALFSLTRTLVITSSAFFLIIIMMMPVYGNFRIGYEKSKPVFLSTMITMLITNTLSFITLVLMGIKEFTIYEIFWPGFLSLIVTYAIHAIIIWIMAHLGNTLYFKLFSVAKTIIIDNNKTLFTKINNYVCSHDKQYKLIKTYHSPKFEDIDFTNVDHIFLLNYDPTFEKRISEFCFYNGIKLTYNANTFNLLVAKRNTYVIDDALMIDIFPIEITLFQAILKRIIDIFVSLIILIVTIPIFVIVAILIKLEDGGSVFYKQERLTINEEVFKIIKFRSMRENSGDTPATKNDIRITKTGAILRKFRIDELPQMYNILRGDMSLVGPRPESVAHAKTIMKKIPEFNQRLKVKGGLTGYAQIFGKYNTTPKMKLRLDLKYIESFSILDDIKLILQTLIVFVKSGESTEAFDENGDKTE